jgi:hypothetical protein
MTSANTPAHVLAKRTRDLERARTGPNARPIGARILSVDPRNEQITFLASGLQGQRSAITHPYMGMNSWLRAMPEAGSSGLAATRGDSPAQHFIAYLKENSANQRREATIRGEDVYRELQEGSIELMSSGRGYLCANERGTLELRGGSVHAHLSQDLQEFRVRAPTHRIECLGYEYAGNRNNLRFGVVKRLSTGRTAGTGPRVERPVKVEHGGLNVYAKEFSVILQSKGTPNLLADLRMGHVVDDDGTEPTLGSTSEKLRYRAILGTKTVADVVRLEVDVKGNTRIQLPRSSTEGMCLEVLDGKLKVQANREIQLVSRDRFSVSSTANMRLSTDAIFELQAQRSITITGPQISIVPGAGGLSMGVRGAAFTPAVLGDRLITVLNSLITALTTGPLVLGTAPSPTLVTALTVLRSQIVSILSSSIRVS